MLKPQWSVLTGFWRHRSLGVGKLVPYPEVVLLMKTQQFDHNQHQMHYEQWQDSDTKILPWEMTVCHTTVLVLLKTVSPSLTLPCKSPFHQCHYAFV